MMEILKYFHPKVKLEILNRMDSSNEYLETEKAQIIKELNCKIEPSNNVLPLIELISKPNLQKDYDMNLKLVQETDFSNLLTFLSNQVGKNDNLSLNLDNLIFILIKNRKSINTFTVTFSLISIYHLQITLIYLEKDNISKRCSIYSLLFKIMEEINLLDNYYKNITSNQYDINDQNNYFMLKMSNECLVLKSYLLNWFFIPLTIPCTSEFEINNQLMYINQTLENIIKDNSYYNLLKYFQEITGYLYYFNLIIKKIETNDKISELDTSFSMIKDFSNELNNEFNIDKVLPLRDECIKYMKNDFILKNLESEFQKSTNEILINQYIQLYCTLELSVVNKILVNFSNNVEDYIEFLIRRKYPYCRIFKNQENQTIEYEQKSYNCIEAIEYRLKPVKEIEKTIVDLLKKVEI